MFTVADTKDDTSAPEAKKEPKGKSVSAESFRQFLDSIKGVVPDLNQTKVEALCSYYIESQGDTMTKEQLIAELKKSAPAPAPAPIQEQKADAEAPAAAPAAGDPMKELAAKVDMIAQALAKLMEMIKPEAPKEEPKAEAAPAEEPKAAPAEASESKEDDCEEDGEEMSEEELKQLQAQIEQELKELEASESNQG
jgi:hypothetical protein